jgi:GT2 family glycosyltransferase
MESPLVSLIILNWNGIECIDECLKSVLKTDYDKIEIIVVDNGSTDGSLDKIGKYPGIKILALKENLGYAAGNNFGFKQAKGCFVATINNDVVVEPGWLKQPLKLFNEDPSIGIIACRQMNYQKRDIIDCLYGHPTKSLIFAPMGSRKQFYDEDLFTRPGFVISAGGASALYRKQLLTDLNGFDERYYSYHEESDLCMRAFLHGWKCAYAPSAVVYHKGSFSYSRIKVKWAYYHERNRFLFIYKFFPWGFISQNILWILLHEMRQLANLLFKKKIGYVYFIAWFQAVKRAGSFHEDRKIYVPLFKARKSTYLSILKTKKLQLPTSIR